MLRPIHLLLPMMILAALPACAADALSGSWVLNTLRTHYGRGAEPRRRETFDCASQNQQITCTIHSVRADGRMITGRYMPRAFLDDLLACVAAAAK